MARIESGTTAVANEVFAESTSAARVTQIHRGVGFSAAGTTGTIAAALAANSSVFAMRLDPSSAVNAFIHRVRLQFTTIVAFTTPLTAGRRLELYRGSGATPSGGTAIAIATPKRSSNANSEFNSALGGDIRIASTGALTVTGITFETVPFAVMPLIHVGAAGNFTDAVFELAAAETGQALQLEPGQLLAVRNPVAMDAAGTWQLSAQVHWTEATAI